MRRPPVSSQYVLRNELGLGRGSCIEVQAARGSPRGGCYDFDGFRRITEAERHLVAARCSGELVELGRGERERDEAGRVSRILQVFESRRELTGRHRAK